MSAISAKQPCLLRRAPGRSSAGAAPGPPLALHQPLLLPPTLLWLLLALLLTLLLALLPRLRGWPLGEPACTCRRCCVKPLAERRWQSTHGRQALKKTAVPEPARELPLAKQARALRRPLAAGCPGRCAIAPAGWMADLWRGARGHGWHSQTLDLVHQPGWSEAGRRSLTPVPLGPYLRPSERHPPEEAPEICDWKWPGVLRVVVAGVGRSR